jgi:BirA family biotin operon repressor/biotin-[acetyl-CoA-carboxylase] ligase
MIWPAEAIWEAVSPVWPGFSVEVLPQVDSSNSELMRRAHQGQTEPVLLVAERQTAGRGRMGKEWHSGEGTSLAFSMGLPLPAGDWSGLSLAVGLSLAQSLHPDIQLKWPNDLWWQERKLAGILIETVHMGTKRYVVVGVGINMAVPNAEGLSTPPAGLCEVLPDVDAAGALGRVAAPLARAIKGFQVQGFAPVHKLFQARDVFFGRELVCSDGLTGVGAGVDISGALLLQTPDGVKKIVSSEVSVRPTSDEADASK